MDIRHITASYAVSPQITPEDIAAVKAAGFVRVICNRPDAEIPADVRADRIRAAAEAAGLEFVLNPVIGGAITMDNVQAQGAAVDSAPGPVFAYCASGNRSTIVWGLSQAGKVDTPELIQAAARAGYNLEIWQDQINALARRQP